MQYLAAILYRGNLPQGMAATYFKIPHQIRMDF